MKYSLLLPVLLVSCVFWSGCETEQAELSHEANPHLTQGRVQFESSTTKHLLRVVRVDSERLNGGLLKIHLTIRNTDKKNLWADIRTTFLDDRQHVLDSTNWEPILLQGRTVTEYTCTSLSNRAADYQIIIRKPKKTSTGLK